MLVRERMSETLLGSVIQTVFSWAGTVGVATVTAWIAIVRIRKNAESAKEQVAAMVNSAALGFRAQVLSANRQAWINELRNLVSELSAMLHSARQELLAKHSLASDKDERMELVLNKLRLMLNPTEPATLDLLDGFHQFRAAAEKNPQDEEVFKLARDKVLAAASRILKAEWVRVKHGV